MTVVGERTDVDRLDEVVRALRDWQHDGAPMQLHPGDVGWFWRFGAAATAAALRVWRRDGRIVAVGLLDEPTLLRLTLAPHLYRDVVLAEQLAADVTRPERGVLGEGRVAVEAPSDALLQELLTGSGWHIDDPWTPLRRDLAAPVPDPGLRVDVVQSDRADVRAAVQRAAFDNSTFSADRWHTMAGGSPYADARCLVAYDEHASAVAAVTVWSAGEGKPGLLEPMGVHRDHRGKGYGRAITLAAATALRGLGSSSAIVYTPSANVGGVATYESAGFTKCPEIHDLYRDTAAAGRTPQA